ncbi:hypothetical protein R3P38DRAFT_3068647 [Favolaschia claudopus]|uniref:F-box domain-containing protein n=1 Tax=Favolaschia claudopus TaxID=2862362 RepID=A0AAW0A1I3_9AGAR
MKSPFAERLGTNYCPTDDEVLAIQKLIAEPIHQIFLLDDEIALLQKAIDKLREQRSRLSSYVDAHKALIFPIRRLPPDIIAEIFHACLPTHRNCVMSGTEAPVLLGRICSSWRVLSLATPRLWASLHIVVPPQNRGALRLEATKLWLGRSGQCPLSISLHDATPMYSPVGVAALQSDAFLKELVPFSKRWKHVRFVTSLPAFQLLGHLTAEDVPLLESIGLFMQLHNLPSGLKWAHFDTLKSPLLTSVSTTANEFDTQLPFRWHILTELSVGGSRWQTLDDEMALQTLSRCPQLRTCKMVIHVASQPGPPLLHRIIMVELVFLHTLYLDFGNVRCCLLDRISAPGLRTFLLRGYEESPVSFLGSCGFLENLDFECGSPNTPLSDCLAALPKTIRQLTLRDCTARSGFWGLQTSINDAVLQLLTPVAESSSEEATPYCCPSLEELTLICGPSVSDSALELFITRRMTGRRTLRRVYVQFNSQIQVDIKPHLEKFVREGLELDLEYLGSVRASSSPWEGLPDASSRASFTRERVWASHVLW